MEQRQANSAPKKPVGILLKSLIPALLVAAPVLYLFGIRGGNWLIAALAALCSFVGIFLCALGWSYFRFMEGLYREKARADEEGTPDSSSTREEQ